MSKAKFYAARELIQEKRYEEARTLLQTISDPKAAEWIGKLDAKTKPNSSSFGLSIHSSETFISPKRSPNYPLFPLLTCLGFGLLAFTYEDGILYFLAVVTGIWFFISRKRYNRAKAEAQREKLYSGFQQIEQIKSLTPVEFENFVGYLFERMGYRVSTTAVTGDHGADLFANKLNEKAVIQCKRYEGTVGEPILRDLYGTMMHYHMDKGYLITTGTIAKRARQWAIDKPLQLIDGKELQIWVQKIESSFTLETPKSSISLRHLELSILKAFALVVGFLIISSIVKGIGSVQQNPVPISSNNLVLLNSGITPKSTTILEVTAQPTSDIVPELRSQLLNIDGINSIKDLSDVKSENGYTVVVHANAQSDYIGDSLAENIRSTVENAFNENVFQLILSLEDDHKTVNYVWSKTTQKWTVTTRNK